MLGLGCYNNVVSELELLMLILGKPLNSKVGYLNLLESLLKNVLNLHMIGPNGPVLKRMQALMFSANHSIEMKHRPLDLF